MGTSQVEQVRTFNRFYTREIGLLARHMPGSDFTLAEARVLYELAQSREQTAADIIRGLGMDKAHISRIVTRLQGARLVKSRVSPEHGKHKLLSLTAAGRKAFQLLKEGTESQIETLLAPLAPEDRELVGKRMRDIQRLLSGKAASPDEVRFRSLEVGDLGWIIHRQAVLYEREYGWDWTYEGLVAQILGEFALHFDQGREDAWIAEYQAEIVGSVFLMKGQDPGTAKLRLLYVDPAVRGLGIGFRLVEKCVLRARELGYGELTLWTNDILISARKIYQAAGFRLVKEDRHVSFGKELLGQTWVLDLKGK